jgi:hypothetical protein
LASLEEPRHLPVQGYRAVQDMGALQSQYFSWLTTLLSVLPVFVLLIDRTQENLNCLF